MEILRTSGETPTPCDRRSSMKKLFRHHDPIESATWVIIYLTLVGVLGMALKGLTGWEAGNCLGIAAMGLMALMLVRVAVLERRAVKAAKARQKAQECRKFVVQR
jgi:hypothetical protein